MTQNNQADEAQSDEFLNALKAFIATVRTSASTHGTGFESSRANIVEEFFYSNVVENFKNNLTADTLIEFGITRQEVDTINGEFAHLFESARSARENSFLAWEVNREAYCRFRDKLDRISKASGKLLSDIEKQINIAACETLIDELRADLGAAGLKPRMAMGNRGGGLCVDLNVGARDEDSE